MAEPNAFVILLALVLILLGVPLLLFGILEYPISSTIGSSVLSLSIFMLVLGAFFILLILNQKS